MRRIAIFTLLAGVLVPVLMAAPAHAQASRTWVSGTGDDNNTSFGCSRTAPCKTFAGAISVTATNGEIDCIDPGGYGTLTITKSITIDCTGTFGSILSSGVNSITINLNTGSDPLASVVLRGLSLNGTGGGTQSGLKGVSILSATVVTLENMVIMNHAQEGVADNRTQGSLFIKNSVIRNNAGVGLAFATTGSSTKTVSIENTHSINNRYGLACGFGNQVKATRSVFSGNLITGIEADPRAQVGVEHSTVNFNGTGLEAYGTVWIDDTEVAFNQTATAGTPVSFGNNRFYANVTPPAAFSAGPASTDRGQN